MKWLFRFWFVLWPLFLGVFLPYVPLPVIGHCENLLWGSLYGIGLFLTDITVGNSIASKYLGFGFFIWPLLLTGFLFGLSNSPWLVARKEKVAALLLVSSIVIAPVYSHILPWLPTYWRLMFAIW